MITPKSFLFRVFYSFPPCFLVQAFRPHFSEVDSVLVRGKFVYSGGDKRVLCSNFHTGTVMGTVTRDSGSITFLFEKDSELFVCSSNGSIRTYILTHTGVNIKMVRNSECAIHSSVHLRSLLFDFVRFC